MTTDTPFIEEQDIMPHRSNTNATTRFVCISDTHSRVPPSNSIPDGDVFVHCGDLTAHGKLSEVKETFDWIEALPHPFKIVVAGNHDYPLDRKCHGANGHYRIIRAGTRWEEVEELVTGLKERGITYLCHESTTIHINGKRWNIFGSPRVPLFGSSAFAYPKSEPNPWTLIPTNTDILITHGPPYGHPKPKGRHGCPLLEREVLERVKPKLHCWGHIHDDYGVEVFEYGKGKGKGKGKSPKKGVGVGVVEEEGGGEVRRTIFANCAAPWAGRNCQVFDIA